jgi:hypothetical protein
MQGLGMDKNRLKPGERYKKTKWDWNQNELNGMTGSIHACTRFFEGFVFFEDVFPG